jgi:hypothetical protein
MLQHDFARVLPPVRAAWLAVTIACCPALAADYAAEFERLQRGPQYAADVPRGLQYRKHQPGDGETEYQYAVRIPKDYTPERRWPVHFLLQGGLEYRSRGMEESEVERLDRFTVPGTISVYPSAWRHRMWWHKGQNENLMGILNALKREYNVDENRVFVQGASDGGSGALYVASHYPTAFAGFVSLIGSIRVLHPGNDTHGMTFLSNFAKPIYALNTNRDRLYPARQQEEIIDTIKEFGGDVTWVVKKGKHNLFWYDSVRDDTLEFVDNTAREPYPDHLRWQVDAQTEFRRLHWLIAGEVIDEDKEGLVDVQKRDNDIFLASVNMKDVTLLLSTEHFDFNRNIRIWVDRTPVFNQPIAPSAQTLNEWHEIDRDRSMLFAAELRVGLAEQANRKPRFIGRAHLPPQNFRSNLLDQIQHHNLPRVRIEVSKRGIIRGDRLNRGADRQLDKLEPGFRRVNCRSTRRDLATR